MKGRLTTGIVKLSFAVVFLAACVTNQAAQQANALHSAVAKNKASLINSPDPENIIFDKEPPGIVAPSQPSHLEVLRAQLEALQNKLPPRLKVRLQPPDVRNLTELPKGEDRLLADLPKGTPGLLNRLQSSQKMPIGHER